MKIILVSRYLPFPGGRENFVYELSQSLKDEHKVTIVTQDGLIGEGVQIIPYQQDRDYLESMIEEIKPDIVNSHTFYMCDPLAEICKAKGIPFVLTLHGDQFVIGDPQRQSVVKQSVRSATSVITVCEAGKSSLLSNTDTSPNKVKVIHNGINTELFKSDILADGLCREIFRKNTGLSKDKFTFVIPARMIWYKGLDFLIETISNNSDEYRKNNLFFLISTPSTSTSKEEIEFMNELLTKCKRLGINDLVKITFSGYEFMPYIYRMVDGFILPSKSEQLPISILEAMATKIPVIATNVGGVSEIISSGTNGLLVDHGNNDALHHAILSIGTDSEFKSNMADNAFLTVKERFSIDRAKESYLDLFRSLI